MKYPKIEGGIKLQGYVKPMLAELSTRPAFTDDRWIFEIKWDGYRAIAEVNGKEPNRLYSRNGTSFAKAFSKVYSELSKINGTALLDGEIVVYDENNRPSFQHIQNYNSRQKFTIQYQVFDILRHNGKDLCNLPLIQRKEMLKKVLPDSAIIRYCDHVETEGELLFDHVLKMDLEGIIAKKASGKYATSTRSHDWLKIKNHKFDEFIIVGFLHSDKALLKSLVIGDVEEGKINYRGHVSGFSDQMMKEIKKLLTPDIITNKPIDKHERFDAPVSWVHPKHICNVRYTEITDDGILRHPVFQGLVTYK